MLEVLTDVGDEDSVEKKVSVHCVAVACMAVDPLFYYVGISWDSF